MKLKYYTIIIAALLLGIALSIFTELPIILLSSKEDTNYYRSEIKIIIANTNYEKYQKIKEWQTQLGLNSLLDSKDSIVIRIWLNSFLEKTKYVLALKANNNCWSGQLILFSVDFNTDSINQTLEVNLEPKNSWARITKQLAHNGIFVLPDWGDLNLPIMSTDGCDVYVEVLDEKYYRFYKYFNADDYTDISFECYRFNNILNILNEELNISQYYKDFRISNK